MPSAPSADGMPPRASTSDGKQSASPGAGVLTFARTCSDKKKSAVELVSP
jgi:hypothetical protein